MAPQQGGSSNAGDRWRGDVGLGTHATVGTAVAHALCMPALPQQISKTRPTGLQPPWQA